jgi:hypothetical protein
VANGLSAPRAYSSKSMSIPSSMLPAPQNLRSLYRVRRCLIMMLLQSWLGTIMASMGMLDLIGVMAVEVLFDVPASVSPGRSALERPPFAQVVCLNVCELADGCGLSEGTNLTTLRIHSPSNVSVLDSWMLVCRCSVLCCKKRGGNLTSPS